MGKGYAKIKNVKHWRMIAFYLILYDMVAVNFAYFFGLLLRFDMRYSNIPNVYLRAFKNFAPIYTVFAIVIFFCLHLYRSLWRFASFSELNRLFSATVITTLFQIIFMTVFRQRMPVSYYVIGTLLQFLMIVSVRFTYRYISLMRFRRKQNAKIRHNAMIIGAGAAGQMIIRELNNFSETDTRPCCVVDDNPNKWGRFLEGVPIVGGRDCIAELVEKYNIDQILFAIPSVSAKEQEAILNICKDTKCELKRLPGLFQLTSHRISLSNLQTVDIEDLLGREPIDVNTDEIFRRIKGKVILVTGGGGSIGSELCRQVAEHGPRHLIIFDIYENNAYELARELERNFKQLSFDVLIGSVRDSRRINWVFETYKPDIVYHAAAHKHVPLMETSPNEAIKNNVLGTYKTAYAALKSGTQRFVLISTDKAVNPTNVMGASKRLCEMIIQSMDAVSKAGKMDLLPAFHSHLEAADGQAPNGTKFNSFVNVMDKRESDMRIDCVKDQNRKSTQFVAVRFGNVLGSNGSVIPLFKKQIEAGGPVTVTHPDIVRYFMTISEAVSLVLQAGTNAWGGEIFVLNMGMPVKIDTLARNLIKLSGYEPDVDIPIQYTGLRAGEKLFEEYQMAEEGVKQTDNKLIQICKPIPFDIVDFFGKLEHLASAGYDNSEDIVQMIADMVPTFHRT